MNKLVSRKNDDRPEKELPKIYFACHPDDFDDTLEKLCSDIFASHKCVIYCRKNMDEPLSEENRALYLEPMNLFVFPITTKLLKESSIAIEEDLRFALSNSISILPVLFEEDAGDLPEYSNNFGTMQYLDRVSIDDSAVDYKKKLKDVLDRTLLDDETMKRISEEFDAYIFLSYRKKDRRLANELMKQIHRNRRFISVAVWYDEYLVPGELFDDSIKRAMDKSKLFMLLVTPSLLERNSKGEKNYVEQTEYPRARNAKMPIIPVEPVLPIEMTTVDMDRLRQAYEGIPEVIFSDDEDRLFGVLSDSIDGYIRNVGGCTDRLYLFGLAYLYGYDVEINRALGIDLLSAAGDAGDIRAIERLVDIYKYANIRPSARYIYNGNAFYWMSAQYECYKKKYGYKNEKTLCLMYELVVSKNPLIPEKPEDLLEKCAKYGREVFEEDDVFMLDVMFRIAEAAKSTEERIRQREKVFIRACKRYEKNNRHIVEKYDRLHYPPQYYYACTKFLENYLDIMKECYENRCRELGKGNHYSIKLLKTIETIKEKMKSNKIDQIQSEEKGHKYPEGFIDKEYEHYKQFIERKEYRYADISLSRVLKACADTGDAERRKCILEEVCEEERGRFSDENMPQTAQGHLEELSTVYERLGDLRGAAESLRGVYDISRKQNGEFISTDDFVGNEIEWRLADLYEKLGEYDNEAEILGAIVKNGFTVRVIRKSSNTKEYEKNIKKYNYYMVCDKLITNCCRRHDMSIVSELAYKFPFVLTILCYYAEAAFGRGNIADARYICERFVDDTCLPEEERDRLSQLSISCGQ